MKSFNNLNPLKKWIITNKFFIKTTDTKERKLTATHYLLDGGIWGVPKEHYPEFLRLLAIDLQNGEKHYISENRTEIFKFICDLDLFEMEIISDDKIIQITSCIQEIINEYYGEQKVIICGADTKQVKIDEIYYTKSGFHLVWPDIWISVSTAKKLRLLFIEKLTSLFGNREINNTWEDVVDLAVYEDNGLRMVGCRKISNCKSCKNKKEFRETCQTCDGVGKIDENRVYSPKLVLPENKIYLNSIKNYFVMLPTTSIYNYANLPETSLIKELQVEIKNTKKKIIEKAEKNQENEILVKLENFIKRNFKIHYPKIRLTKLVKNENLYYAQTDENFCMNVNRDHSSSTIYFQITQSGISQRCYCKKETTEGRSNGPCKEFSTQIIPLNKILQNLLFPDLPKTKSRKKIVNMNITRTQSNVSLDLSVSKLENYKDNISSTKLNCLVNCKNILSQIEFDLSNLKK